MPVMADRIEWKEDKIMAIVITNGNYYITYTDTGATKKTKDINDAYQFTALGDAIRGMNKARGQTKNYYVYDTFTQHTLWKRMTQEELIQAQEDKTFQANVKRCNNGKIKRKKYSQDTRKLIYNKAGGRCELCGRPILFSDMTLDHVKPLSMGGLDEVENLACVCLADNRFKDNVLPEDFIQRITEIFLYQTEKKNGNSLKWKIVHRMLVKMI